MGPKTVFYLLLSPYIRDRSRASIRPGETRGSWRLWGPIGLLVYPLHKLGLGPALEKDPLRFKKTLY